MQHSNIILETNKILKKNTASIIYKIIISILYRGTLLIIPILWGKSIDLLTRKDFAGSYQFIIITAIITILYYLFGIANQHIYYNLYNKLYNGYSKTIYQSVIKNSLYSLSRFKIGEFTNIINTDVDIVVAFLADAIIKIIRVIEFLVIFYYFYTINFVIFSVTVILCLIMLLGFVITGKKNKILNFERKQRLDKKTAITNEVFHTVKEIKGFYVAKSINDRVKEVCNSYLEANSKYNIYTTIIKTIIPAIIETVRYALIIYGAYLFSLGQMEIGTILVIYTYYSKVIENYDIIGSLFIGLDDYKVSIRRLDKLLEYCPDSYDTFNLEEQEYKGDISFKDVLYGDKRDPILNKVSLIIPKNSITVITGNPGTGKTGVFDLLMKLNRKHSGDILIDGNPYEMIDDELYYSLVSLVRKEPSFFDISIKDNLMLVNGNFSEVRKVCEKIGIDKEIMSLKNKYNTEINSQSEKISNNLKRAIAVARVILKDSKIMMFDETVSMLDIEYQDVILKILKQLSKDHTIIIISKDQKCIDIANKVITFENSKVKKVRLNKKN